MLFMVELLRQIIPKGEGQNWKLRLWQFLFFLVKKTDDNNEKRDAF